MTACCVCGRLISGYLDWYDGKACKRVDFQYGFLYTCLLYTSSACMANHTTLESLRIQAEEEALAAKKAALAKKEAEMKAKMEKKDE